MKRWLQAKCIDGQDKLQETVCLFVMVILGVAIFRNEAALCVMCGFDRADWIAEM
ncbi:MAG: hypothetical protein JSR62_16830 [Nitrospira sp.]|nr:hypothetical protein [Nitrospira sp.]